jgi:3'(2'), 5'-bisphosphate nucleotidase
MESLDAEFARWLASSAGELLLSVRDEVGFADPAALKSAGDLRSHSYIAAQLAGWRPDDAVLSEEAAGSRSVDETAARLDARRVWIVDPLDGTREYAEEGRTDWAVHIALWTSEPVPAQMRRRRRTVHGPVSAGGRLAAGAIALPAQGIVLATDAPPAAPAEAQARGTRLRIACSRTRPPAFLAQVAEELDALLVPMGSAGAKIAAVITGEVDAYIHDGGQYEWDSAAPVAVANAVGLHTSRLDGTPLRYNEADPRLPDLLVCRTRLARTLVEAVAVSRVDTEV